MNENKIIEFLRKKDFKFIEELGYGSFGKTILIEDEDIKHKFVCKKYKPSEGIKKEDYYSNFVNEIKLLHLLYHKNIVRVFNYYLYQEIYTGYIMMEYIDGLDIYSYIEKFPENINMIFEQTIKGFTYLEEENILHRDIREANILVTNDGTVKIIDFGFGKQILFEKDNKKDISINWLGDEKPNEFKDKIYDNKTEIFFIGKLFQTILTNIETSFKYKSLLKMMLEVNYKDRISSFEEIDKNINNNTTILNNFNSDEKIIYKDFRQTFFNALENIKLETTLVMDSAKIIKELEILQKRIMLEDYVSAKHILRIFLQGSFVFNRNYQYDVDNISDFLIFFKKISQEKQNIVLYNIETLLDDVEIDIDDDEIPF